MNVDVLDVHLPDLIRCIYMNNEFHNPLSRAAVVVSVVQNAVLLHYAEDLLPVDQITGSLQVFRHFLVAIADELPAQEICDVLKELLFTQDKDS